MNENLNQNAINPNNENNNTNNTTNVFNLIIGIATLLIAILGATFAYFSATAQSAENDVTVKSAYVSISYDGGTEIKASNLIPATLNVAMKKYQKEKYALDENNVSIIVPFNPETDEFVEDYDTYVNDVNRKCVDAKGKEVCYVYQFTIESDGEAGLTTDVVASVKINNNQFDNLSYVLYEVDLKEKDGVVVTDKYGFGIVDVTLDPDGKVLTDGYKYVKNNFEYTDTNKDLPLEFADMTFDKFMKPYDVYGENEELIETVKPVACLFGYVDNAAEYRVDDTARCASYPLPNKIKHTYQLVIWLEETGYEQPEQGLLFEGTVAIEVSGGVDSNEYNDGQITGQE